MIVPRIFPIPLIILSPSFDRGSINFSLNISPNGFPTFLSTVERKESVIFSPIFAIESLMDLPALWSASFNGSILRDNGPMILLLNHLLIDSPIEFTFFAIGVRNLSFMKVSTLPKIPPSRFFFFRVTVLVPPFPSGTSTVSSSSTSFPNKNLLKFSALAIPVAAPRNPRIGPPGNRDNPGMIPIFEINPQAAVPANAPVIAEGAYFFKCFVIFSLAFFEINPLLGSSLSPKISFFILSEAAVIPPIEPNTVPIIGPAPRGNNPNPPANPPTIAPKVTLGVNFLNPS